MVVYLTDRNGSQVWHFKDCLRPQASPANPPHNIGLTGMPQRQSDDPDLNLASSGDSTGGGFGRGL